MALVRLLYFCAACYDINVVITHISGIDNLYLAGLCLAHLELGHSDPTVDESLRLVIRGIRCLQGESCRARDFPSLSIYFEH